MSYLWRGADHLGWVSGEEPFLKVYPAVEIAKLHNRT